MNFKKFVAIGILVLFVLSIVGQSVLGAKVDNVGIYSTPSDLKIVEGEEVNIILEFSDLGNTTITVTLTDSPSQSSLTPLAKDRWVFAWRATEDRARTAPYDVTFRISDGGPKPNIVTKKIYISEKPSSSSSSSDSSKLHSLERDFDDYEDRYFRYKAELFKVEEYGSPYDKQIFENKLGNLYDDLSDLRHDVRNLISDSHGAVSDDAYDLKRDIERLQDKIEDALGGDLNGDDDEEDVFVSAYGYESYKTKQIVTQKLATNQLEAQHQETGFNFVPTPAPQLTVVEAPHMSFGGVSSTTWVVAGIIIALALLIFLVAILML